MSSSDISWETVGIAVAFNVVATVAIMLLAFVIIRCKYKLLPRHKCNGEQFKLVEQSQLVTV